MTYDQLIQLYFERSSALQWYWTLYVVIIGGLLAFSSQRQRRDLITTSLITVLFLFFAYKNLGAIQDVTFQRYAVIDLMSKLPAPADENKAEAIAVSKSVLGPTLTYPGYTEIKRFHIATDLLVIAALWAFERRRRFMAADTQSASAAKA